VKSKIKIMKNLIFIFWFLLPFMVSSQNNLGQADDYARISLNVFIPEQVEKIPAGSKSLLINKLTQAATKKGMAGGGPQEGFYLLPIWMSLQKMSSPELPINMLINLKSLCL
jgi:hypothetical protein